MRTALGGAAAAALLLMTAHAQAAPQQTWTITHPGQDCVIDQFNPLDETGTRRTGSDPLPGTPEWDARDKQNRDCAGQRSGDRRFQPLGNMTAIRYGQDPYRMPDDHNNIRFRFDRPTIPDVPAVEVYRPCPKDVTVCPNLPATLERFDPPYPVVVVFHGLTASKENHRFNSQAFAEAGYLTITVNGTAPDPVGNTSVPNVQRNGHGESVLTWLALREHDIAKQADLNRVGFAGHSQGGIAVRSYQGDKRVHTIVVWDGGDVPSELNTSQPMMFQRTDGGFATPSTYLSMPDPAPRRAGYEQVKAKGLDVLHFTARALVHVDWNGAGGPGYNRLNELLTNYYNLAWFERYLKGRLALDEQGAVITSEGRTEAQERAYRQAMARAGYRRLIADRFDNSSQKHNISMGFWDPEQAEASGDPLKGGNVPYNITGTFTRDRFAYYYPSWCFLSLPDYVKGATGGPNETRLAARADTGADGDMRLQGCPEVKSEDPEVPPMTVALSATPTQGDITNGPLNVTFNAQVQDHQAQNGALTYTFYFGDGSHSGRLAAPTAQHAYDKAGTYQAVVVIADEAGNSAVSEPVSIRTHSTVTVDPSDALQAALSFTLNQTRAPATALFDASGSTAPESAIFRFDFGDGSPVKEGTDRIVRHVYTTPGRFTATLTLLDGDRSSEATATVTVTALQATTAQLTVSPARTRVGEPVSFDATASLAEPGRQITSYRFDFGDGSPAVTNTTGIATHAYARAGQFLPSVTVTDDAQTVSEAKAMVQVAQPSTPGPTVKAKQRGGGAAGLSLLAGLLLCGGLATLRRARRLRQH